MAKVVNSYKWTINYRIVIKIGIITDRIISFGGFFRPVDVKITASFLDIKTEKTVSAKIFLFGVVLT